MATSVSNFLRRTAGSPLLYLINNRVSLLGVVLVTTATVFWLFLLPTTLSGQALHPYIGILAFLAVPAVFFLGLILIPLGIRLKDRREHRKGIYPAHFPPLNFSNPHLRRLALFVCVATLVNLGIGAQFSYEAVTYMDSVSFCGQTCHTVMQPEYTAYLHSPHARVECVECHIGPGASWFVRSKLSGTGQVFAALFHTYPTPIPVPVKNLRPARETCETCHWPQQFASTRLRVTTAYADDEKNSMTKTVILLKTGRTDTGVGIHGMHVGTGIRVRYWASDESRQTIPWVEYTTREGKTAVYAVAGAKPTGELREMDCIDCHNRPTHIFQLPDAAVDQSMADGAISPALPFAKKESVEILRRPYTSRAQAAREIPAVFSGYYRRTYPAIFAGRRDEITRSAAGVLAIWDRNVFPAMKVNWGTYPNNIGHADFPGCFRCHDGNHVSASGAVVTQDCSACHNLLAVEEANPKILSDLGLEESTPAAPSGQSQ